MNKFKSIIYAERSNGKTGYQTQTLVKPIQFQQQINFRFSLM